MSNHAASYLLNDVLVKLNEQGVFNYLGKSKTRTFIQSIIDEAENIGCSAEEVLEEIGLTLGLCSGCLVYAKDLEKHEGLCQACNEKYRSLRDFSFTHRV